MATKITTCGLAARASSSHYTEKQTFANEQVEMQLFEAKKTYLVTSKKQEDMSKYNCGMQPVEMHSLMQRRCLIFLPTTSGMWD